MDPFFVGRTEKTPYLLPPDRVYEYFFNIPSSRGREYCITINKDGNSDIKGPMVLLYRIMLICKAKRSADREPCCKYDGRSEGMREDFCFRDAFHN